MATTSGALLSDHVNYLIFRYLQESGHESSARSFYHDWYRPVEYRDPEELPFAGEVRRAALVSVIQDGLRYAELQERVAVNAQRRHVWSQVSARNQYPPKPTVANGADLSTAKRKSIGTVGHHVEDSNLPALKKQRTSPEESVRINGNRDVMDIDNRSPSVVEDEDEADPISPALASEPETPAIRYDSVATQTDIAAKQKLPRQALRVNSLQFTVDKPNTRLFDAAWNPSRDIKDRRTLVATGEGLCRLYKLPEGLSEDSTSVPPHLDEPGIADDSMITAVAWHPNGRIITCAVNAQCPQDALGRSTTKHTLIDIGPGSRGTISHPGQSLLLQPPGIVLKIEYSPSGEHLLVASTNTIRSLVEIWATPADEDSEASRADPIAWCFFEHQLTDVAWCENLQLRACTASNQASILMLPEQLEDITEFTPDSIRRHNLIEQELTLPFSLPMPIVTYRYVNSHWLDLYLVQSQAEQSPNKMVVLDLKHHDAVDNNIVLDLKHTFTTVALQPTVANDNTNGEVKSVEASRRLLAVGLDTGDCLVYELGRSNDVMTCNALVGDNGRSLKVLHGPILAATWSPNGNLLALAGEGLVQIWNTDRTEAGLLDDRPLLTWRAAADVIEQGVNGVEHEQPRQVHLNWDTLGQKLCFVVGDKVCSMHYCSYKTLANHIGRSPSSKSSSQYLSTLI